MLHILFLILKIIGIILLVILGITLALVGVVLFVPIRYRLKTETSNGMRELKTEAKATWLLHLISAYITYQDEKLDWQVRVGWKKFHASEENAKIEEDVGIKGNVNEEKSSDVKDVSDEKKTSCKDQTSRNEASQEEKKSNEAKTSDKGKSVDKKRESWIKKIKCTIREICDKIKHIKDFLMEETHIQAFLRLKKELVFFMKKIKPDKIKGYLRFGLEDPYNTGRALAVLSILYPFYGEHIQIYPEFEQEIIEGDVYFKGRIHLVHLLLVLGRAYFDKNVKTAYKNLQLFREK